MIRCAVYVTATGEINQISQSIDLLAISSSVNANQSVIEIEPVVLDHTHYISDGAAVRMPAQDSPAHTWNWITKSWVDSRTLAAIRAGKWESIKLARDAAINAPLPTPRGTFDSDANSRFNLAGAVALAQTLGAAFSITYTLADNTSVVLDGAGMVSVGLLLGAKVQAAFVTARSLRVRIDAALTADDVAAILWPAS